MRRFTITALAAALALVAVSASAQQWPAGEWKVAVIATDDQVHIDGGAADVSGSTATIVAGGQDIWDNADQFTYLYKEVSGDFDVAIVVQSIENTNTWAKAGIMARLTLDAGSINVLAAARANNDMVTFQQRPVADAGGASERIVPDGQGFLVEFPTAIRLMKAGNMFTGDWGSTGSDWSGNPVTRDGVTPTPPIEMDLGDSYLLGVAVTSHSAGVLTTAVVDIIGDDGATAVDATGKLATTWGTMRALR
ncbi:hypothetical protein HN371_20140 [Candidatus Poribacteria bacterium]|nr:hypothetical protein [Candidatus Poribacteria bacterium]MBT5532464.1 hypothetical protein [Candidatus Poribacteria bacterium]MBT7096091.1 hypothetical protein [Candidatus Poribacteria bacterium]MBT7804153.1 hypothetical protein [Candidatus Poribacteria bacterium]